ncbi:MAG: hypothetical protein ABI165_18025 [Bryobacteraceae bacterium]
MRLCVVFGVNVEVGGFFPLPVAPVIGVPRRASSSVQESLGEKRSNSRLRGHMDTVPWILLCGGGRLKQSFPNPSNSVSTRNAPSFLAFWSWVTDTWAGAG